MRKVTRPAAGAWLLMVGLVFSVVTGTPAAAYDSAPAGLVPVAPCVVLDTSQGVGAFAGPLDGDDSLDVQVEGSNLPPAHGGEADCGVPVEATGVVVNVSAEQPLRPGNLRVFPADGTATGGVVNFNATDPLFDNSNEIFVPTADTGHLRVEVNAGPQGVGLPTVDVSLTVVAYLIPGSGSGFNPVTPCVFADSRANTGATGAFAERYTGSEERTFDLAGQFPPGQGGGESNCDIPVDALEVMVNLVAINPTGVGAVGIRPASSSDPTTFLDYAELTPSMNNSNAVLIPFERDMQLFTIADPGNSTDVRAVVLGYTTPDGARFSPIPPCTAFDSRPNQNPPAGLQGPYVGGQTMTHQVAGTCGVPADAGAVLVNLVALNPVRPGNLRAFPTGDTPSGGVLNFADLPTPLNNSNAVVVPLSDLGQLDVTANAGSAGDGLSTVDVRGVILGYFEPWLSITIDDPVEGADLVAETLTVNGTAAGEDIDRVEIRFSDNPYSWNGSEWSASGVPSPWFPADLTPVGVDSANWTLTMAFDWGGTFDIIARVYDSNDFFVATSIEVTLDAGGPDVIISEPQNGRVYSESEVVSFAGRWWDDTDLHDGVTVELRLEDIATGYSYNGSTFEPGEIWGPASIDQSTFWDLSPVSPLGEAGGSGSYRLHARGIDSHGRTGPTVTRLFSILDETPPVLTVLGPTQQFVRSPATLTGEATDVGGVSAVEVMIRERDCATDRYFDGSSWVASETWLDAPIVGGAGTATVTWALTPDLDRTGGCGTYSWSVRAEDPAGNSATLSASAFITDSADPTVEWISPVDGGVFTPGQTAELDHGDDNSGYLLSVQLVDTKDGRYWNGTAWQSDPVDLDLRFLEPLFRLGEADGSGNYRLDASITDIVGRTASSSVSFTTP